MMNRRTFLALPLTSVAAGAALRAQEGHPLTGTWSGEWTSGASQRTRVTLVIGWEGNELSGVINPGPNAIPVRRLDIDLTKWTVHLEAEGIAADVQIEELGSYRRRLVGTWTQANATGPVTLTRD
jgi:hypothetical protein